jgi:DNA replication licensing factor MCM5
MQRCLPGNYRLAGQRYIYREKLLRMHRRLTNEEGDNSVNASNNSAVLEVDVAHLGEYDGSLLGYLREQPATILPALEQAASDALDTLLYDLRKEKNPEDDEETEEANNTKKNEERMAIQVLLKGNLAMTPLRSIKSEHINRLIRCPGIVISASPVRSRGIQLVVRCSRCSDEQTVMATDGPFGTVTLPTRCAKSGECGLNPYSVVPDESQFCDRQTLKLQEAPEKVPTGEMPRSVMVAVERSLVDKAPPGTRVSIFCIPMLFSNASNSSSGVRSLYLRVIGLSKDHQAGDSAQFTPAEEEAFSQLARRRDVYEILTRSVAPSISGSYTVDIKKALVCMLMGGTRKRLPDGMRLRGDINVLLLGDPSTAKSQFLKFVSRTSPIGIYTSGKGSSAAGLTASVVRDSKGEFYLEGGAMVLADGGIVCIDEFDKMRPADRVAIHEAMEQQTISIAKAGITTVLNSRSAVLAAANPVYGRYDDFKSASENIDLMTTILSRFDLIFLVRDVREEERDRMICRHVMGVHINNSGTGSTASGDVGLGFLAETMGMGETEGTPRYEFEDFAVRISAF